VNLIQNLIQQTLASVVDLTLSYDARAVEESAAGAWFSTLRVFLESPESGLL
jgi:hypothetical protein